MSSPTVVIDASNQARGKAGWYFARVVQVRDAWLQRYPDGYPIAVLDAGVERRLNDRYLVRQARADGWLEIHRGDADDLILRLADKHGADVVSHDKFLFARSLYPWLEHRPSRIWHVRRSADRVKLLRHVLQPAAPEEVEKDRRAKAGKAGLLTEDPDRRWRHVDRSLGCERSDTELIWRHVVVKERRSFCRTCQYPVEEIVAVPADVSHEPAGTAGTAAATVTLLHGSCLRWTMAIPHDGAVFGRRSRSTVRPDVDVTEGLPPDRAREISRVHLRLLLDDDGEVSVVHVEEDNASFLNPSCDADGRPTDARLLVGEQYALDEGDEVVLGPGVVRLRISRAATVGAS